MTPSPYRIAGDEPAHAAELVEGRAVVRAGARDREREQAEADDDDHDEARDRPVRDLRGQQHPDDQPGDREDVEGAVRDDRADERRPRAAALRAASASARRRARARRSGPGSTAFPNRPTEKAEKTSGKRGTGGAIACRITVSHATARATTESRLSPIAATTHFHCTALKASPTIDQSGPRHQSSATTAAKRGSTPSARQRPPGTTGSFIGRTLAAPDARDELVDAREPPADVLPRVALEHEPVPGRAERAPALLVGEQVDDRVRERRLVPGRHEQAGLRAHDRTVAGDVRRDHRRRPARAPRRRRSRSSRRRAPARRTPSHAASSAVRTSFVTMPSTSIPSSSTRSRARRSPTCSGSVPIRRSRAPVRRRISGQARSSTESPLRGSWRPTKTTGVLPVARVDRLGGTSTPFGITS